MKRKDMSPSNIHMITTYLESKINRKLTPEEEAMIEKDLVNNYEIYEYPEAEIAELMEAKYNLSPRGDDIGMTQEEAIDFVKRKEEEGYEANLYDDGHFDGFLDAVKVIKDLLKHLDRTNLPVYMNFISSMEEIDKIYNNLHRSINRKESIDRIEKALNRKLTEDEFWTIRKDPLVEKGLYYGPDVLKVIHKYKLGYPADWYPDFIDDPGMDVDGMLKELKELSEKKIETSELREGTATPVLNQKINDDVTKLVVKTESLIYKIGQELRKDNFETVPEVEKFFMGLIEKDARIPTDHQLDRLMNLAKVLVDIPQDVLIRHYESIMEDKPLKDR